MSVKSKSQPAPVKFRVLSYNIHQGLTIHRRKLGLSLLKEAIKLLRADLVLLQEVAGTSHARSATKSEVGVSTFQLENLADAIWPHYAYQKNAVFSGGFHGNAILSRYPIVQSHHLDITVAPFDKRGALHAVIEIPPKGIRLHAIATHLGLLQFERRRQVKFVCEYLHSHVPLSAICLIGGDFNDWQQTVSKVFWSRVGLREVHRAVHSTHARTFPARFPVLPLDRIYFRRLEVRGTRCLRGKPWPMLSDHLPLLADFNLISSS